MGGSNPRWPAPHLPTHTPIPTITAGVIEDDGGAVHACLREHEDALSPDCKAWVAGAQLLNSSSCWLGCTGCAAAQALLYSPGWPA